MTEVLPLEKITRTPTAHIFLPRCVSLTSGEEALLGEDCDSVQIISNEQRERLLDGNEQHWIAG